jgi:fused signal recognition particle receptor
LFDKLREAFSSLTKVVSQRKLSEKDLDEAFFNFQLSLLESDVAQEAVDKIVSDIKGKMTGTSVERSKETSSLIKDELRSAIISIFVKAGDVDVVKLIREKKATDREEPFVILFLGINGTGKTTTVAKFAYFLKQQGFSVVVAAGDTHRAGAIEQLSEHANRISVKVIAQRYGADPAAVARDGVLYAKAHHSDVLIVDTAGRMQTNKNLMEEMGKIVRVVRPDFKIFIGDSLAGNDAISQAQLFNTYTGFDGSILTKSDADTKGGAALSIAFITSKPILFLGVGQEYKDLKKFQAEAFVDALLS